MRVIVWDQNSDNILLIPEGKNVPHGNYVYGRLHDEADPPLVVLDLDSMDAPISPQYFSRLLDSQYGIQVAIDDILQESDGEVRMSAVYGRKTAGGDVLSQAWEAAVDWLSDLGWGDYDEIDWDNLPKKKIFNQVMKQYDGGWAAFLRDANLPSTPDMMDMIRDDMNQESYEQATALPPRDNSDMYENGRLKWSNILDPIHEVLDQRVFNGTSPKLEIFGDHLHHVKEILRQHNFDPGAFEFYLTGSLCTYQYSDQSDVDISIITKHEFSEEDRSELISIVIGSLDGERFPGTNYRYQHFVQPEGVDIHDLFAIGVRAGYDFQKEEWVVKPDRTKAKDMHKGHPDWIAQAILISDKINSLIDNQYYKEALEQYQEIHRQRRQDQAVSGDESFGNIVYKFLNNNGTFERLRNIGAHIAKTGSADILDQHLRDWDQFVEENPGVPFDDLFDQFNLYDKLVYDKRITPEDQLSAVNYLNKNHSEVIYPEGVEFPPGSNLQWVEPKMFNKDSPGYPLLGSMEAIMRNEYDKFNQRQAPRARLKWTTEDEFKTSHWKPGWRSAILIPQQNGKGHHLVVADDDEMTHPQLRNKYMLKGHKEQLRDQDYWRGLYHPETGTLAHMSTPEEEKDVFGMEDPFGLKNQQSVEDDAPYSDYEDEYDPQPRGSGDFDWGGILQPEEYIQTAPVGYKFDPGHEQVWRNANNVNNVPINSFKHVVTEDPTKAFYENRDNDLMFVDPTQGVGRFMQQAPHLMRTVRNAPGYWDPEEQPSWQRRSKWIEAGDFNGYWLNGFEPAVILDTPKGPIVHHTPSHKGHPHTEAHGLDAYEGSSTTGWRGLYNPQTAQMLHLSDPEQEDHFLMEEEGKNPAADAHQTWQNAAKNTGLPISNIKTLYVREGANPTATKGTEDDYYFADPEAMAGKFMQQAPNLMRTVRNAPGYWDPEEQPSWQRMYSAWMNPDHDEYMKIFDRPGQPTHLNSKGRPCNCGFGRPDPKVMKRQTSWIPITSSWQILAATPEEVIKLIAENDLKEGSKWDRRFPGAREQLLMVLKDYAPRAENTQWAWRSLINIAKKSIQQAVQPTLDKKWEQDQKSNEEERSDEEKIALEFQEQLKVGLAQIKLLVDGVHGLDNKLNMQAWRASELARILYSEYGGFLRNSEKSLYRNTANSLQIIGGYNKDYDQEKFDNLITPELRQTYAMLTDLARDLNTENPIISDVDIKRIVQNEAEYISHELRTILLKINTVKPLIDRYNIPFDINQYSDFGGIRQSLTRIEEDARGKEEYRNLLSKVEGTDPDDLWQGRVVASYPLKDGIWTIREVTAEDAQLEGELMSHCIGDTGQPHVHGLRQQELTAYSVRDPKGVPWATFTMSPDGDMVYECYGRHDHKVRTAWDKAFQANMSEEESQAYVEKNPLEQEIISKFIEDTYGDNHPFLAEPRGSRSGVLNPTPDFGEDEYDEDEERDPIPIEEDHPLQNSVGDAPYLRSSADLPEYIEWLNNVYRQGMENYLTPGGFEGYDDDYINYDDDEPYFSRYSDYDIYDYNISMEDLVAQISAEASGLNLANEEERARIASEVLGLRIHQIVLAYYRNNRNRLDNPFEFYSASNKKQFQWLYNLGAWLNTQDLAELQGTDGEDLDEMFLDDFPLEVTTPNYQEEYQPSVWQEEPSLELEPGQQELKPHNFQALINALQPYTTPTPEGINSPIRLSESVIVSLQNAIPYIKNENIQTLIGNVINRSYGNGGGFRPSLDTEVIKVLIQRLTEEQRKVTDQQNQPIWGQQGMFEQVPTAFGWSTYDGTNVPSITSKWKVSYFEGYKVDSSRNRMQVSDPKTGEPVAHVVWHPWEDGHLVEYLGYSGNNGEHLHPNRDAKALEEKKKRHPGLAMDLLRWTKDNVPGPYYAGFANQKLRKVLQGEPTGKSFHIDPEYAEELGEPNTEISIDRIRRSKWVISLNGNDAWHPSDSGETQSLTDENPYESEYIEPKWKPKKWRREPEDIDAQSEALDSPSVEKWLKASGRDNNGVIFSLEPDENEALAIDGGEEADILHCTLVYLENTAAGCSEEDIEKLKEIGAKFAEHRDIMDGKITAMAEFPSKEGPPAQVALVSCVGLDEFRATLKKLVEEAGFELSEKYGFIPHITLAYQDEPVEKPDVNLTFSKLTLRVADEPFDFYFETTTDDEDQISMGIKEESEEHGASFDMNQIEQIVKDHLKLDPEYYEKESSVDWSSSPYAYHNTKPENIPAILEQGLVPWNQRPEQSNWEKRKALQPVTDRVYLRNENFPKFKGKGIWTPNQAPLQIDLSKMDPNNFRADEDYAAMLSDREMAELLGDLELVKMFRQQEKELGNRGKWYENVESALGTANPFNQRSFDTGSFTHHGIVPPEAISLNPNYKGKIGSWKIAMPPADQVEDFAKYYEQGQIAPRNKGVPAQEPVRGHKWELIPENLEKLYNMPEFPLKSYKNVRLYDPSEHAALTGEYVEDPHEFWNNVAPGGEYRGNNIYINPFLEPDKANNALWHELQHGYQYQEGRADKDYAAPKRWDQEGFDDSYYNHPMELDANQFADYMERFPLIRPAEPHYDPRWLNEDAHMDGEWNPETEEYQLSPDQLRDYIERIKPHYGSWKEANWDDNVWYHVTNRANYQAIRDHGLAPRESMGQGQNFNLPVGGKVVYLHPNVESAVAYASKGSLLLENTKTRPDQMLILRIRNIDKTRLLPDHEAFQYKASDFEYGEDPLENHYMNYQDYDAEIEGEWNGGSFGTSLDYLMQLPASQRVQLIGEWSENHPTEAVMYLGTIPAQNIDVVGPAMQNDYGVDRKDYEFTDMYSDAADYLKEQRGESELYPWEDDNDSSKDYFKYKPMFSKWQLATI